MGSSSRSSYWLVAAGIAALPTAFWLWFARDEVSLATYVPLLALPLLVARAFVPLAILSGAASAVTVVVATGMGFVFVPVALLALGLELTDPRPASRALRLAGWAAGFLLSFAAFYAIFWRA